MLHRIEEKKKKEMTLICFSFDSLNTIKEFFYISLSLSRYFPKLPHAKALALLWKGSIFYTTLICLAFDSLNIIKDLMYD